MSKKNSPVSLNPEVLETARRREKHLWLTGVLAIVFLNALVFWGCGQAPQSEVAESSTRQVENGMCPALGWSEGLPVNAEPDAVFPTNDTANNPSDHCAFHQWSWEAFIWATASYGPDQQPRFMSLPTTSQLGEALSQDGGAGNSGALELNLKVRAAKGEEGVEDATGIDQASGGVLVDPRGNPLFYSIHMDQSYFDLVNKYYGPNQYAKAPNTLNFPVGSAVFKASWGIVSSGTLANVFTTKAYVPYLKNSSGTGLPGVEADASKGLRQVEVALLGLHVVGVTDNHPEFLWGTFEHKDNAPNLPSTIPYNSDLPVSSENFTLYTANTPARDCNQQVVVKVTDPTQQTLSPRMNVFRQFEFGGETAQYAQEIVSINTSAQGEIANTAAWSGNYRAVWKNYNLIGTVWLEPNTLEPGQSGLDTEAKGSVQLANSTMETFVQGPQNNGGKQANCFMCHNTAGNTNPTYPGKNINLSHTLLEPFFE